MSLPRRGLARVRLRPERSALPAAPPNEHQYRQQGNVERSGGGKVSMLNVPNHVFNHATGEPQSGQGDKGTKLSTKSGPVLPHKQRQR